MQISTIKFGGSDGTMLYINHGGAFMVYVSIKKHVILFSSFFGILFLAALGIRCFAPAFSSCGAQVLGTRTSVVAAHRPYSRRAQ